MPFWWKRRRKPWFGRWRYRKTRYNKRRRQRRKRYRRRPYGRRRRRRRRQKVRRKRKALPIKQWQPASIVKCKIKGITVLVLGADGRQNRCYTANKNETVYPRTPAGGGFGYEVYNLKYLYQEYKAHNNIWTKTNDYKDLVRFLGSKITIFRHPWQDFIVQYDNQPPFNLTKYTYMHCHPFYLLLQKHHKLILSTQSKPNGKVWKTFRIKPTKTYQNSWFFQKDFATKDLFTIKAAALNINYSYMQCCNENMQLSIYYLNMDLYHFGNWGDASQPYHPYFTAPQIKTYHCQNLAGKRYDFNLDASTYTKAIDYKTGWFAPEFLQSVKFYKQASGEEIEQANIPINFCIYNPSLDLGPDNLIFLHSLTSSTYRIPSDEGLYLQNVPLWLGLYGFIDWIAQRYGKEYLTTHCICLKSKALLVAAQPGASTTIVPIDPSFRQGNQYFNQPPTQLQRAKWFPTILMQQQTINDIVESGPYVPKLTNEKYSTWELKSKYLFHFKWGGPEITDPTVNDPTKQGFYATANTNQETVQVRNPEKQKTETMFHEWDLRRGVIKESAIKRMYENMSVTTDVSDLTDQTPEKKRQRLLPCLQPQNKKEEEMQTCLQTLFEKNIYQESTDLQQLIQQQQQQQDLIKHSIYKLLMNLKQQQNKLQLHTGLLN
nr:MAG: ORF1 [Torque teno midi virus]